MLRKLLCAIQNKWHPLWRLRQVPGFRRLQRHLDRTIFVPLAGLEVKVAVKFIRDAAWFLGEANFEPQVRRVFSTIIEAYRPRVFWDIGANIGYYGWLLAASPAAESVVMFEPDPENFSLLRATVQRNALTKCDLRNAAVAERPGNATFLVDRVSGATGTLAAHARHEQDHTLHHSYGLGETITCATTSVDHEVAQGTPPPELVKIDVEGAELTVLAGALDTFKSIQPIIVAETFDGTFAERLEALGYAVFTVDVTNIVAVPPARDPAPIAAHFPRRTPAPTP